MAAPDVDRIAWLALGALLVGVVVLALARFLGALVFALFVYYASRPVYARVRPHTSHPDVATTVTVLVFVLPVVAVVVYGTFVFAGELAAFLASADLPGLESALEPYVAAGEVIDPGQLVGALREDPGQVLDGQSQAVLSRMVGPITTVAGLVVAVLSRLFLALVFVFYLLRDDEKIAAWFRRSFGHEAGVVEFAEGVDEDLEHVFFGNLMTILATAAIAIGTYFLLDLLAPVDSPLYRPILLGALVGIGTLVPVVGMKIVYLPVAAALVLQALSGAVPVWFPVVFLVVTFVVVDAVPDFFVRAYLSAGEINMGLILLAYVLGPMAFGWYGLFLGPIVVVVLVHFAKDVFPQLVAHRRVG